MNNRMLAALVVLALCIPVLARQEGPQLKIGEPAPGLGFDALLQAPQGTRATLDELQGKVVILYFWGPHAKPCIDALGPLNKLIKQFKGKPVQLVAITSVDADTARKFADITPIEGWIAIDRDLWIFGAYSASPVPHVVVIDKQGRVAAMVKPEDLTEAAIKDLLADKAVNLPLKVGKPVKVQWKPGKDKEEPEPILQIAIAPCHSPPQQARFSLDKSNRRLTARALPLPYLVATAYRAELGRVVSRLPPSNDRYRVSLIVPKGHEQAIYAMLQEALDSAFDLSVTWQRRSVPCLVLTRDESVPLGLDKAGESRKQGKGRDGQKRSDRAGHIALADGLLYCYGVDMAGFAAALESSFGVPIVDETEISGRFDVTIQYRPGDIAAAKQALNKLGLRLEEEKRQVRLLVIDRAGKSD